MYITQAFNVLHDWWRYVIGVLVAIIGVFVFSLPHLLAIIGKRMNAEVDLDQLDDVNYLMTLFDSNTNLVYILLPFAGGLFFLWFAVKLLHKQSIRHLTTSRIKIDWKRIWFAFFFWGILSSLLIMIDYFLAPENYVYNFEWQRFAILAVIAIVLVPLQTSFEEYLFRGYLMQGIGVSTTHKKFPIVLVYIVISVLGYIYLNNTFELTDLENLGIAILGSLLLLVLLNIKIVEKLFDSKSYNSVYEVLKRNLTPLIITSFVFGMLHIANPEVDKLGYTIMIYYIGTGLFLGVLTLMDEGLELALGFHAANNLFTALLVTANWTAFQTHSIFKDVAEPTLGFIDLILPVFILFPLLLFIFAKKYKWTNWKDRLVGKIEKPPAEDYKIIGEN